MFNDTDEEEEIGLDRRHFMPTTNTLSDVSHSNLTGFHPLDTESYYDVDHLSKKKAILLAVTCTSIGMITGLLGPIVPFLAYSVSVESSSVVRFVPIKALGFLLGTCLSASLYSWFNVCCLMGLACLSISFGVCSLAFITDLTALYLTALILGIGLGLSYNGVDALYNRLWARPSASAIRWLHLCVAFGAIFSTAMLLPSTANITQPPRLRRAIVNETNQCASIYCCYDRNNGNRTFICQEGATNQSDLCLDVFSSCPKFPASLCRIDRNSTWCRIDQRCPNQTIFDCPAEVNPSTAKPTLRTKVRPLVIVRKKPPTADSDNDDLSQNFLYSKLRSFIQSMTHTHLVHLFLAGSFFLLGIFYSTLAMRGEGTVACSLTNLSPVALLFLKPHPIINHSNTHLSCPFIFLVLLFYFVLVGMESSCVYLTYSFGIQFSLSESQSLILQLGYLAGRSLDLLVTYIWFLLDKYKKNPSNIRSIKYHILLRLIVLFAICLSNFFHSSIYFLFGSIGFLLTSLSSLLLYWIERDLSLNELFLRLISLTTIIGEMIFPLLLFDRIEYLIEFYLFIGLALLIGLFLLALYASQKWQRHRMYRLLSASMDMHEMEPQENSDTERLKDTKLQ